MRTAYIDDGRQENPIRNTIVYATLFAVLGGGATASVVRLLDGSNSDKPADASGIANEARITTRDMMKELRMGEKVTAKMIEGPVTVQKPGAEPKIYPVSILVTPGVQGSLEGAVIGVPGTNKKGQDTIKTVSVPASGEGQEEVKTTDAILYMSDLGVYSPAPEQHLYIMDLSTGRTGDPFSPTQ